MIDGSRGNDIIATGTGNNTASGGAGADTFVLDTGGFVTITDFEVGLDNLAIFSPSTLALSARTATSVVAEFDGTSTQVYVNDNFLATIEGVELGVSDIQADLANVSINEETLIEILPEAGL